MSRSTISTFQLFELFPDEQAARVYIEKQRWMKGADCPECQEDKRITTRKGGFYRCNACYENEFTFRLNDGDVMRHTLKRLASLVTALFGSRLTYKELTA